MKHCRGTMHRAPADFVGYKQHCWQLLSPAKRVNNKNQGHITYTLK
jgi:hypothetical protein